MDAVSQIRESLFRLKDEKFREFNLRLLPTTKQESVIGVRVPDIRRIAKKIKGSATAKEFLHCLPHDYHEENLLHVALICGISEFGLCLHETDLFLPYIDNWAVCDMLHPRSFYLHRDELLPHIFRWIVSEHPYTVRFAVGMLMWLFLDQDFRPEYANTVAELRSDHYYVKMGIAWYFATALAKQQDAVMPYFVPGALPEDVRKMAVQKARDSFRVPESIKTAIM